MRALATLFATLVCVLALPSVAQAEVTWLCLPGSSANPCEESLQTTVQEPDGSSRVETPQANPRARVDCFYVYPTVSSQPGPNATKAKDPEVLAIARYQAQRFSQQCRVFAPVYRQLTVPSLFAGAASTAVRERAFGDVREAWQEYLRVHNNGRPVVLIGHSQGTFMLRALMRTDIDNNPSVRSRLLSALLLGGNVLTAKGKVTGGDFANVPACTRLNQYGCVVAWSAYNETPPSNSRFGRSPDEPTFGLPGGPQYSVLCTDPEKLTGGEGSQLTTYVRTDRFPGLIGAGVLFMYGGQQPTAPTPWLRPRDRYTGHCAVENGASILRVDGVGNARKLRPSPDATWGIHLADVNIGFGELQDIVSRQTDAYFKLAVGFGRVNRALRVRPRPLRGPLPGARHRAPHLRRARLRAPRRTQAARGRGQGEPERAQRTGAAATQRPRAPSASRARLEVAPGAARGPGTRRLRPLRRRQPPLRHQVPLGSATDRARRGISGVLYPQSALAGLNSHPRGEAFGVSTPP